MRGQYGPILNCCFLLPHYLGRILKLSWWTADMAGTGTERPLRHELRPDARVSSRNGSQNL